MRSVLLLILTVLVLVGLFAAYLAMQQAPRGRGNRPALPTTTPTPRGGGGGDPLVGAGEDLWARSYDRATGRLTLEFHAEQYEPQPDGSVTVTLPEARFHLRDGRCIAVAARDGRVVLSGGSGSARQLSQGRGGTPTRGELRDVVIELYDSLRAPAPMLAATLPVVSFDNDTFRIATEATVIDGRQLPADQAPVRVEGQDLQFDGRGLVIRWNGMTGQLDSLEVAHGERLTLQPGSELFPRPLSLLPRPADTYASAQPVTPPTTGRRRKLKPISDPSAPASPPALYRATFRELVRVSEGEQVVAAGQRLSIDFMVSGAAASAGQEPVSQPSRRRPRTPATRPASHQAAAAPITIRWTGPLRIEPLTADAPDWPERPRHAEDHVVRLHGAPAELSRDGSTARFAELRYRTVEETVVLRSSADHPQVELDDGRGTRIHGPSVVVNRRTGVASIDRGGGAELPVEEQGARRLARLAWADRCDLVFRERDGRAVVDSVSLLGSVELEHPRLTLNADELSLAFEPAAPSPPGAPSWGAAALRLARAVGNVRSVFIDAEGRSGTLAAGEVSIGMANPSGEPSFVRTVSAEGKVQLMDERQWLRCDRMSALFDAPPRGQPPGRAPQLLVGGNGRLSSFRADGNVALDDAERRSSASGSELLVAMNDGLARVTLVGMPARVVDGDGTLEGPRIEFEPDADRGRVVGPGRLRTAGATQEGSLDVRWRDRIEYDGAGNVAEVVGEVLAESIAPDNARQTASAARVTLLLADTTTGPATQASVPAPIAPRETFVIARPLAARNVRQVVFREKVELSSVLNDAAGRMQQRTALQAEEVRYDLSRRRLEVPVAGRMLHEDARPVDPQATVDLVGDLRGATALQWRDRFVFDEQSMTGHMSGAVRIVQRREGQAPLLVNADVVDAEFVRATAGTRPTSMSLKRVVAAGDVSVAAPQAHFTAARLEYDPVAGQLVAGGSMEHPVETFDEQGLSRGGFERLVYNTRTRQVDKLEKPVGRIRR